MYLCRGVLVAFHPIEGLFRSVDGELGRVVAAEESDISYFDLFFSDGAFLQEALAHVHNGLDGRRGGGFIDDGPREVELEDALSESPWKYPHAPDILPLSGDSLGRSKGIRTRGGCGHGSDSGDRNAGLGRTIELVERRRKRRGDRGRR